MAEQDTLVKKLTVLNEIAVTLNRAVDVRGALHDALVRLVELMGLETGWIFLVDPDSQERWFGKGYTLLVHHNLPPGMALHVAEAWDGGCDCQGLCSKGKLTEAYNEVRCSRLAKIKGDRGNLLIHATTPLRAGDQVLGILNVAAPAWEHFSQEALALLTNAGNYIGIALERARLYDLVQQQRIQEQAALLDMSDLLLGHLDLDDLMHHLVTETQRLLGVDGCALMLPNEAGSHFEVRAASGWWSDPALVGRERRIPADGTSGAGRVMRSQQSWVVVDVRAANVAQPLEDWLEAEDFRCHAVVPLVVQGRSIGVLVVNHRQPHQFDDEHVRLMRLIANQAAIAIERARLQEAEIRRQRIEHELALATDIQLSMLPESCPAVPGWEFAAVYQAARQVGGDFYDFIPLSDDQTQLGLVIADVADKGVPAALFMALSRTVIRGLAIRYGCRPAEVLRQTNMHILRESKADLFLSACYACLDTQRGSMAFANAGHNPPLWLRAATGEVRRLKAPGMVLGVIDSIRLEQRRAEIEPGDVLVFYTDGVSEAHDADFNEFGAARLEEALQANRDKSAGEIADAIVQAVSAFTGDVPQFDDFTMFVVRRVAR